jgi:hypothetical protein
MDKHPLSQYKNLTDWAIRAHRLDADKTTLATMKHDLLRETNEVLGTNYKITSMNQWLASTRDVPKKINELWTRRLIDKEVSSVDSALSAELNRLLIKNSA